MAATLEDAGLRKARGAFFTPPAVARYISDWAVREPADVVLEPSCGEAAFLLAAGRRLRQLGALRPVLRGHELHEPSAVAARTHLRSAGYDAEVKIGNFFEEAPDGRYDAVVGNPPYVRYQDFSGTDRSLSRRAAERANVSLTGLASSWAAFTVHAALFVRESGRLGLVLPAELLSVNYAADVRSFLLRRFGRVRLVLFRDRVFPGVLEEVVLLLAEGGGGCDHMELLQVDDVEALLTTAVPEITTWTPRSTRGKWTEALLPGETLNALTALEGHAGLGTLQTWGETTLGAVTGNNGYFALRPSKARELGLTEADLVRISPPGSRHLRSLSFTARAWEAMAAADERVWLFRPASDDLSSAAEAYRENGWSLGVHEAYKCRVRKPWWRVPLVPPADLLLTYMNADTPRLSANRARVHHLNSVHGVYLAPACRPLGMSLLPLASLNTLTLLGAETVGRAYGGGMLKLEPREADHLPLPTPALVEAVRPGLEKLRPRITAALRRRGGLLEAVQLVDHALLVEGVGLAPAQVRALSIGRASMTARRVARGRAI